MKRAIDEYREIYTYFNDETLDKATIKHPELLKRIIEDATLSNYARAETLYFLAYETRPQYFEFILSYMTHPEKTFRMQALWGLDMYYEKEVYRKNLRPYLMNHLKTESCPKIKERIQEILSEKNL